MYAWFIDNGTWQNVASCCQSPGVPPIIYLAYLAQVSGSVPSRYPVTVYSSRAPQLLFIYI